MWLDCEGDQFEATPDNAREYRYAGQDILNGLFIDREEDYIWMAAGSLAFNKVIEPLREEGVRLGLVQGLFDPTEPPHCWIIASVGRLLADAAEQLANGYVPE